MTEYLVFSKRLLARLNEAALSCLMVEVNDFPIFDMAELSFVTYPIILGWKRLSPMLDVVVALIVFRFPNAAVLDGLVLILLVSSTETEIGVEYAPGPGKLANLYTCLLKWSLSSFGALLKLN